MYAVKGNKQYTITEAEKKGYRARGFDIVDDGGELLEAGAGKTVAYAKYQQAQERTAELEKALAEKENRIAELEKALAEKEKGGKAGGKA